MDKRKRDKTKVDPLSGAEDKEPAQPLQTVPTGKKAEAKSAIGRAVDRARGRGAARHCCRALASGHSGR